jgi:hypothetical protein
MRLISSESSRSSIAIWYSASLAFAVFDESGTMETPTPNRSAPITKIARTARKSERRGER